MMDAGKRKNIVYVLFGLALIYGLYNLMISFDKESAKLTPAAQNQLPIQVILPAKTIDIEQYSSLNWGRDPFYRPKKGAKVNANNEIVQFDWILNGILFDKHAPTAVINKKIVGVGDKINGAKIITITKTKVTLKKEDSDIFTLQIYKDKS